MSGRRLYAVAARALLRDTVLDAVSDLLAERDWAAVTMAEVARAAGLSRQTLYNEFGDRAGLAQAFLLREGERLVDQAERAIDAHRGDPRAAVEAAFSTFLSIAEGHPIARAISAGGAGDELLAMVTTRGTPVLAAATERLAAFLAEGWPGLDRADAALLAGTMVRLAISHAALPGGPPGPTAAGLARLVGPFVEARMAGRASQEDRLATTLQ